MVHLSAVRLRARPVGRDEGMTHSNCTLEFEDHRPLYDWLSRTSGAVAPAPVRVRPPQPDVHRALEALPRPARERGSVRGWDDPRMPTVLALRRRGLPEGVRNFLDKVGVGGKGHSAAEIEMLEHEVRDVLNRTAPRRFAVLRPIKVVIENYPQGRERRWRPSTTRKIPQPGRARCPSRASSGSSVTISWRNRRASSFASTPAARCVSATPTS